MYALQSLREKVGVHFRVLSETAVEFMNGECGKYA